MTETTLKEAVELKSSIDELERRREKIRKLESECRNEGLEKTIWINVCRPEWEVRNAEFYARTINHALDEEIRELEDRIRALRDKLDKLH